MNPQGPSFPASATHPDLPDETIPGRIFIDQWQFRFECEDLKIEIPWDRLKINFGKEDDTAPSFYDLQHPRQIIYATSQDILDQRVFLTKHSLRVQMRKHAGGASLRRAIKATLVFLAIFALISVVISWASGIAVTALTRRIPIEWETSLGDSVYRDVIEKHPLADEPQKLAELKLIGAQLKRGLPPTGIELQFHIIDDDQPNAHAIPGGHVFVNQGLYEVVTNRDELAGVLAHEIAHVTERHGFRKLLASVGPWLLTKLLFQGQSGVLEAISAHSLSLVQENYSRNEEDEADAVGWDSLVRAKIDPRGLAASLEKIDAAYAARLGALQQLGASVHLSDDHPPTEDRVRRLNAKWDKLDPKPEFIDLDTLVQ